MGIGLGGAPIGARTAIAVLVLVSSMVCASSAEARISSIFDGDVDCELQADGVRFCGSDTRFTTTPTFDGVPIDVSVGFPRSRRPGPMGTTR